MGDTKKVLKSLSRLFYLPIMSRPNHAKRGRPRKKKKNRKKKEKKSRGSGERILHIQRRRPELLNQEEMGAKDFQDLN